MSNGGAAKPCPPRLNGRREPASGMATEINGDRQPRDVRRIDLDVDAERRHAAPKSLRADAELVDAIEQLAFELTQIGAAIPHINRPEHRLLREERGGFERTADADTDDDRRT